MKTPTQPGEYDVSYTHSCTGKDVTTRVTVRRVRFERELMVGDYPASSYENATWKKVKAAAPAMATSAKKPARPSARA